MNENGHGVCFSSSESTDAAATKSSKPKSMPTGGKLGVGKRGSTESDKMSGDCASLWSD